MISKLDYTILNVEGGPAYLALSLPENISPKKYFQFALDDIKSEPSLSERVRVNAFSNLKRALHFQVEIIANAFGYQQLTDKKYSPFPPKLDFCRKCGVVSPRILSKLNQTRNLVEHSYYIPKKSEVEDYLDIVELFLAATDHFIFQFPSDLEVSVSEDSKKDFPDIFCLMLPPNEGMVYLPYRSSNKSNNPANEDIEERLKMNSIKISVK